MAGVFDDDELLALVGDESEEQNREVASDDEGGEETLAQDQRSPSAHSQNSNEPSRSTSRRGMATKPTARRRRASDADEDAEGSSVPGSPASQGSAAMDESDSDDAPNDYSDATDANPYPLEGKYRNAADRAYVLNLPMLQQEQLLAEREEEINQRRLQNQLLNLVNKNDAEKNKKRKAGDLDDERAGSRVKTDREKRLDSYKEQRKAARDAGGRRAPTRRRSRSASASDLDADGEDDYDYGRAAPRAKEPELPAELNDIERIRVGRSRLAKVCLLPRFEQTMVGCFARVCIGRDAGRNVYRVTIIKAITKGKPYLLDGSPETQPFYTDLYATLAHGKSIRDYPFDQCSDSGFLENEFTRWKIVLENEGLRRTTQPEITKICEGINAMLDHHLTSEEINEKIAKKNKYKHLMVSGHHAPPAAVRNDTAEKIRLRNEKAKKQNSMDVRKALMVEKQRQRKAFEKAREEMAAKNEAAKNGEASASTLQVPKSDLDALFSESDMSRAASPALSTVSTPKNGTETPKKKGLPKISKMQTDDEAIADMGFGMGIDIEV